MTLDLNLATVALGSKAAATSKAGAATKLSFADALGTETPPSTAADKNSKDFATSAKERLQNALLERLRDQDTNDTETVAANLSTLFRNPLEAEAIDGDADAPAGQNGDEDLNEDAPAGFAAFLLQTPKRGAPGISDEPSPLFAAHPARGNAAVSTHGALASKADKASDTASAGIQMEVEALSSVGDSDERPAEHSKFDNPRRITAKSDDVNAIANAQQKPVTQPPLQASVQIQLFSAEPNSSPTQAVLETIKAEPSWAAYFRDTGASVGQPIQSLKIQLHPAELGAVTAHLRTAGDAVAVEITADTVEAHKHLTAEADNMLRSLRQVGIEVDRITVHLADNSTDAKNPSNQEWRNFSSFQGQDRGGSENSRRNLGTGGGDGAAIASNGESRAEQSAGRYI